MSARATLYERIMNVLREHRDASTMETGYLATALTNAVQPLMAPIIEGDVDATALFRPSADPGAYTPRGDNYEEPLYQWQARAIVIALRQMPVEKRMELAGMRWRRADEHGPAWVEK